MMTPMDYLRAAQMMRSGDLDDFADALGEATPPPPRPSGTSAAALGRAEMQRRVAETRR